MLDASLVAKSLLRTKKHIPEMKKYCLGIKNLGNVRLSRQPDRFDSAALSIRVAHKVTGSS
jgi:hypothetical protein